MMDTLTDNNPQLRMAHAHILDMVQEGAMVLDVCSCGGMLTRATIDRQGCEVVCDAAARNGKW